MKLSTLLRRLGLSELARRAGVSPATVRRWMRSGPSARGQDILDAIAARHRRSLKAARTRVSRERERFRERLPVPVSPDLKPHRPTLGQFDDPRDLVPDREPIETEDQLRRVAEREGHDVEGAIDTEGHAGESYWVHVGQPVVEVSRDFVVDTVLDFWRQTGRRWAQVLFLFFRLIPFNPLYQGDATIAGWQGKWKPWWVSTEIVDTEASLARRVDHCMDLAAFSAETRLIWLQGFKLRALDEKAGAKRDYRDRPLRRT